MTRRSLRGSRSSAFAVLLALLPACDKASDESDAHAGTQGGGNAGTSGTAGRGGAGGEVQGAVGGRGTAAGGGGEATGGTSSGGSAGRASTGGTAGAGAGAGTLATGGRAGSTAVGGRGGGGASGGRAGAGESALGGAGGEPDEPSACADPFETVDLSALAATDAFDPYVVTGTTANQIRQSIDQNRGMDYDAFTSWYLTWRFDDCYGKGLVVTADVTYRFPEWNMPVGASPELVASWETYMDALFCHEYGHSQHGLECANEVVAALVQIDAGGDCDEQQAEADAAFARILSDCQELDVQYDAETQHGATMGAVFPP